MSAHHKMETHVANVIGAAGEEDVTIRKFAIKDNVTDSNLDGKSNVNYSDLDKKVIVDDSQYFTQVNVIDSGYDTGIQIPVRPERTTEAHRLKEPGEGARSKLPHWSATIFTAGLSDSTSRTVRVSLTAPDATAGDDVSNDSWLDSCQFLAGEDEEEAIFDCRHQAATDCLNNSKESDYLWGADATIGQFAGDLGCGGAPLETWSSTDCWASALSDWATVAAVRSEDLTSLPTMAIQSQEVERPSLSPARTSLSGEACSGQAPEELPAAGLGREKLLDEPGTGEPRESLSAEGRSNNSERIQFTKGRHSSNPTCTERLPWTSCDGLDCSKFPKLEAGQAPTFPESRFMATLSGQANSFVPQTGNQFKTEMVMDFCPKGAVIQHSNEELVSSAVCQRASSHQGELQSKGVREVTEDSPRLVAREKGERSHGLVTISDYPSSYSPEAGRVCEKGPWGSSDGTELQTATETRQDARSCGHTSNSRSDTSELDKNGQEEKSVSPQFIMPLASLRLGSYFCHTDSLETSSGSSLNEHRAQSCSFTPSIELQGLNSRTNQKTVQKLKKPALVGNNHQPPYDNRENKLSADSLGSETSSDTSSNSSIDSHDQHSTVFSGPLLDRDYSSSSWEESLEPLSLDRNRTTVPYDISALSKELSNLIILTGQHFMVSQMDRIGYITLEDNPHVGKAHNCMSLLKHTHSEKTSGKHGGEPKKASKMPHKHSKATTESKTRSKNKEKSTNHCLAPTTVPTTVPTIKQHGNLTLEPQAKGEALTGDLAVEDNSVTAIETLFDPEKIVAKAQIKKKKKQTDQTDQNAGGKMEAEPLAEVENGARQKGTSGKVDMFKAKQAIKSGKTKEKPPVALAKDNVPPEPTQRVTDIQTPAKSIVSKGATGDPTHSVAIKNHQGKSMGNKLEEDAIKRRRLSLDKVQKPLSQEKVQKPLSLDKVQKPLSLDKVQKPLSLDKVQKPLSLDKVQKPLSLDKIGKTQVESKQPMSECTAASKKEDQRVSEQTAHKKAYSDVIKQRTQSHREVPKVVQSLQAAAVPDYPQNLTLWCQFTAHSVDCSITWTKEEAVLLETKRSAGDESRLTFTVAKAGTKDLGRYQCHLSCPQGSVLSDFLLTYEVLSELVIPSRQNIAVVVATGGGEEEDVKCARLLFKEDFLCEQYFGEDQAASLVTEKTHFGEGMHRRAFRTKLQAGLRPSFTAGHPCVLKVHNAVTDGTKNSEELVCKNYNLAVEECHVQNTAREYIKAYTAVAQSSDAFGDVPEIIPIYLVHRPSNNIPYATLEEELMGDFVKYSVKDGKEINLKRQDSEAGQKCCAFQHWVYHKTEGNLLVTDMQGVGMRLTDVGIATSKKGYKGFKGNCATSFIDQFKALHQCNKYCELLALTSLQPKPRRSVGPPKPKAQPQPKKKPLGPTVRGKS